MTVPRSAAPDHAVSARDAGSWQRTRKKPASLPAILPRAVNRAPVSRRGQARPIRWSDDRRPAERRRARSSTAPRAPPAR
jgi:hypothetical protein